MQIRKKTSEQIQAETAAFVDSKGSDTAFRKYGKNILGSVGNLDDLSYSDEEYQDYIQYLRSRSGDDRLRQGKEAAVLARYDEFREPIDQLVKDVEQERAVSLGKGRRSYVYKLSMGEEDYAVRFVAPDTDATERIIRSHVAGGVAADGQPGLEKVVAASYDDAIVISKFVEGKHLGGLSQEAINNIPDTDFDALLQHRIDASKKGIKFDLTEENILYDPEYGFTDIDYGVGGEPLDKADALAEICVAFSFTGNPAVRMRVLKYVRPQLSDTEWKNVLALVNVYNSMRVGRDPLSTW